MKGVNLTNHFPLVLRLRISAAISPLLQFDYIACRGEFKLYIKINVCCCFVYVSSLQIWW